MHTNEKQKLIELEFLLQTNEKIRKKNKIKKRDHYPCVHIFRVSYFTNIIKLRSVVYVFSIGSQSLDVFVSERRSIMEFNTACANGKHMKTLTYIFTVLTRGNEFLI